MLQYIVSYGDLVLEQITQTSNLEWIASISGFACVYLAAKQHILNWPISIISVLIYCYLFFQGKLYGDAMLQIYFLGIAIYGWYYWAMHKQEYQKPVVKFTLRQLLVSFLFIILLSFLIGYLLDTYTNTDVPYIDGFCTSVSFIAQYLMSRKVLQNWLLWIFVDICYIPLYLYKNLVLTAILYLIFAIVATIGYYDWRKTWQIQA